jgi:flagellar hook-associated protein 3 FlgL
MSGRITPAMMTSSTLTDIDKALSALQRSSSEMSSGKKILEPSDDPYGTSHAIDLQSQLEGLTSYEHTVQDGISWESTSSAAMSSINQVAQRVRELLVQGANGTFNHGDLEAMATEVQQLTESIKQDANTQYAGQYVFSGTATTTPPYEMGANDEYQGNAEAVSRAIGPGAVVGVSTNISTLLGNGQGSGDGKLLETLRTIAEHLLGGTAEDRAALTSTDMKSLDTNLETLSQLQATAGSVTDQLQTATIRIEDLQSAITTSLSNTEDANLAEVSINYANEHAAYEAALRAGATIIQESLLNFLN